MTARTTTAALWIAFVATTLITLGLNKYIITMPQSQAIFSAFALVQAIIGIVLIVRAGFISLQTLIVIVFFVIFHRDFREVIIFTVGMIFYS